MKSIVPFILLLFKSEALYLDYLDPTELQTRTSPEVQEQAAYEIIEKYKPEGTVVDININPILFKDKKDVFNIRTEGSRLYITASTGVAAVWGFNYFLKKYCKSQVAWQNSRINTPHDIPEVDEVVVANDKFRYYQNVRTASFSFVWWGVTDWVSHVEWMALNGLNLVLAPIAQEAAWTNVYRKLGLTEEEIDDHFTGPAYLSWLRAGSMHGWNGPLLKSWHDHQKNIQDKVVMQMLRLGMIPVLPAFNGHVPRAFSRIYPNATFYSTGTCRENDAEYNCNLFLHPSNPQFVEIGKLFLNDITSRTGLSHIYVADPFSEVTTDTALGTDAHDFVRETAIAIYKTIKQVDNEAVWMIQNWMFIQNPEFWSEDTVQTFLTSVPIGRMLVLDLQSEQSPQYDKYSMYYGQPFIWCMLHNFGGTLGMHGNMNIINTAVYEVRNRANSTMIGIGVTPEGINQNYVMYDLMLETAWRKEPVDLEEWVADYAERRYGCNNTASAWKYLLRSVYNFSGKKQVTGNYVITHRPSFELHPWAWYSSRDLFKALRIMLFISNNECYSRGYYHDLVDVTRQALQYRAEQIYLKLKQEMYTLTFNSTASNFLDVMDDIESILRTNSDFSAQNWFQQASAIGVNDAESYLYKLNGRYQITLWGPDGKRPDYACKQWSEMFRHYYTPRWRMFLSLALHAMDKGVNFDEQSAQRAVRSLVEQSFLSAELYSERLDLIRTALKLYAKWAYVDLEDLPRE